MNHIGSAVSSALLRFLGGADGDRTHDLRLAKPALSQLSYGPQATSPRDLWLVAIALGGGPGKIRTFDPTLIKRVL